MLEAYCTVVSLSPFKIVEEKPGVFPGRFSISPSDGKVPKVTHIPNCVTFLYINDVSGSATIQKPCDEIAASIVNDFCESQLESDASARPAVFWIPGKLTSAEVMANYKDLLLEAIERQKNWFKKLVAVADDDWARYHQHKSVSDTQREAAKSLGLEREWIITTPTVQLVQKKCIACQSDISEAALICPHCRAIQDVQKAEKAGIKFAA